MLKFYHLKIVNGAMDARKWIYEWRYWNISNLLFSFEYNRGAKAAEVVRNICVVYETMPSERTRQENGFLVLRRIVLLLVTLHVQEDLRGLMKIV